MNGNDETGRGAARYEQVGWTVTAVLVGLAIGTMSGLRLAASAPAPVEHAVAIAPASNPSDFEAARSRLVQRHLDFPTIAASAADASEEPGMSIAAYGN